MQLRPGSYEAWNVRDADFPRGGPIGDQLRFIVRYAVLAPSAHNTQPWLFRVAANQITLLADLSRALPVSDPTHRELYISVGCALENLRIAAEHFGFRVMEEDFPGGNDGPVVRLSLAGGGTASPGNDALFAAIPKRHTNRAPFEPRPVPLDERHRLRGQVNDPEVRLDLVSEPAKIVTLAHLTAKATAATLGRADFRAELSRWVRNNYTKRSDGMPGFAVGVPNLPSLLAPVMVRLPPMATSEAAKARARIAESPLAAVISSREDASRGWVKAGVAFQRLSLAATAAGLRSAPYAGAFEAEALHEDVERLLGITGFRAVAMLRIGYGPADPHPTPRRPVEAVLQ